MQEDVSVTQFQAIDEAEDFTVYLRALEAFDGIAELQELKAASRQFILNRPCRSLLDVGCGFGLETQRLASGGDGIAVTGIDRSRRFIEEARRRAAAAGLDIAYHAGDAAALPFADDCFDAVRAERLLLYLDRPETALAEMRRVLRPGGRLALIEPDFSTTTVNLPDRALARKVLGHEADTAVVNSWLPGLLPGWLGALALSEVTWRSRVLVFPPDLALPYFSGMGPRAREARVISEREAKDWTDGIDALAESGRLFGSVGYFLFTASL